MAPVNAPAIASSTPSKTPAKPLDLGAVVGVIGAGAMGAGIAQVAAQAGHRVKLYDKREGAADDGKEGVRKALERRVDKGKMPAEEAAAVLERLVPSADIDALADCRLVIEAVVEDLPIKRQLFQRLAEICGPDALLASNTSSLSITAIAAGIEHPERIAGLHFFNPAPVMKLVEVVSGLATGDDTAAILVATAEHWGKVAVKARSTPGFIVNRVARPFYAEGLRLLEEGATDAATLDHLMRGAGGFAMGPFELMDLIGQDVNYAVTRSVFDAYYGDPRFTPSLTQQALVEAGRLGRKSGQGFFDYRPEARAPRPALAPKVQVALPGLQVMGTGGPLEGLVRRADAAGVDVIRYSDSAQNNGDSLAPCQPHLELRLGELRLRLCDGRSASECARDEGLTALVLLDLCHDYESASSIGLAASHATTDAQRRLATALLQRLELDVAWLDDIPGLVVLRSVTMLANEAFDALHTGVASQADIDRAMRFGVNYPVGPLDWAERLGLPFVHACLSHLQQSYGEPRYRPSFLLRQRALTPLWPSADARPSTTENRHAS
ncbi:3-hydroxyacyl-CoA dehydrogenase [Halomonas sp. V046]|uniref:3-hydroxyacyl-CoA dehydrogenase n=1 Tax=Halomonas sp. V046 TaxID=3459611 RepID=UPI0040440F12